MNIATTAVSRAAAPPSPGQLAVPASMAAALHGAQSRAASSATEFLGSHDGDDLVALARFAARSMPPAPGAAQTEQELAEVKLIATQRTPLGSSAAAWNARYGATAEWNGYLREYAGHAGRLQALKATKLVYEAVLAASAASMSVKRREDRDRPFKHDSSVTTVVPRPSDNSYPSGHATAAYAAATVLGTLWPERKQELERAAEQVAFSRVYGGVHYMSDVVAGAYLGSLVGRVVATPEREDLQLAPANSMIAQAS